MKTLSLSIELSSLALEACQQPMEPQALLQMARRCLNRQAGQLGRFIACRRTETRSIGQDISLQSYELRYEKQTLLLRFARLQARGAWELQGFRWAA